MSVQLFGQCSPFNNCATGLLCIPQNKYYSQCLQDVHSSAPLTPKSAVLSRVTGSRRCTRRKGRGSSRPSTPMSTSIGGNTNPGEINGSYDAGIYSGMGTGTTSTTASTNSNDGRESGGSSQGATPLTTKGPIMQGKTTRYWDCCKPSCADPANTGPVSKPVGSCQKDGISPAGPADQSGCKGGNAFTCNNNQPFFVNSTMVYGFAAASIQGMSEQDRCCACFKIDFTSGPVSGKSMIVQVTNSGGDLGTNQFDLQIPGSGVGLFNGCSPQWNAPLPDAWGGKYGGIGSIGECDTLPRQLQAGCQFRFQDFFQASDNPSMNFQRVTCPVELTDKTGCKRNDD